MMSFLNKKSILLVEDDPITATIEKKQLMEKGYCVQHVMTGEEAVKNILNDSTKYELILMDIDLGSGIDGTQTAEKILRLEDIPVVFLSSHTEPEIVEKTEKITSYGYVVKNSGIVVLDASIKMALKLYDSKKSEKKNSDALAEKSEYLKATLNSIGDAVITADICGNITNMNYVAEKLTGWDIYEGKGKPLSEIFNVINSKTRKPVENPVEKVLEQGKIVGLANHTILISKDLKEYHISDSAAPIKDLKGNIIGVVLVFRDITNEYHLQESIKKNEERIDKTLKAIPDMVSLHDRDMNILYSNWNGFAAVPEEKRVVGTKCYKTYRNYDACCPDCQANKVLSTKKGIRKEIELPDGAWFDLRVLPIIDKAGNCLSFVEWVRDISDLKKTEDELKKSKIFFEKLLDTTPIPIFCKDKQGFYTGINKSFENFFGISRDDFLGKSVTNLFPKELADIFLTEEEFYKDNDVHINDTKLKTAKGEIKEVVFYQAPLVDHDGNMTGLVGAILDVTDREKNKKNLKQIQWMLSKKETKKESFVPEYGDLTSLNKNGLILSSLGKEQLRQITFEYLSLLETSSAVYEKNGDYALGIFSSNWCQLMDNASRKLCNTTDNKEALNCGKWLCHESCWRDASLKAINSGKPADIQCKGGINLYAVPIRVNDEIIGTINFGYGVPPEDKLELQRLSDLYKIPIEKLQKARQDYQIRPQFIVDYAKERIQISAMHIGGLIERKRYEQKLQESKEKYQHLFETIDQGVIYQDANGAIVSSNPAAEKILGMSYEQMRGKTFANPCRKMITEEGVSVEWEYHPAITAFRTGKKIGPVIRGIYHPEKKSYLWLNIAAIPLFQPGGNKPYQVYAIFSDVTNQKRAAEEIQEQNLLLSMIMETSPVGITTVDKKGNITYANRRAEEILGLMKDEITSRTYDEPLWNHTDLDGSPLPDEKQPFKIVQTTMKAAYNIKHGITWPDGKTVLLSINASPMKDSHGNFSGMVAAIEDVTEQVKNEKIILKQLTEKEILLKEVHHRVKNNIANIENFLKFQNDSTEHPEAKEAIKGAITRVQAMCLLYDNLLLSKDFHEISMKKYAEELIDAILNVFVSKVDITIEKKICDFTIVSKQAIHIGIIINELLTNAFKYAFKNIEKGYISITIDKNDSMVIIIIHDNGIGIDERILENKTPGFGLAVVKMLVEQLNGSYSITNDNGTKTVIQFQL